MKTLSTDRSTMSLVTADVVMMPPGAPPIRGKDAVRATFERMFAQVALRETWTSEEVVVSGETAYDWSSYSVTVTPRGDGVGFEERGQNFFVARREADGGWRYAHMMWNRDQAPSGR